MSTLTEILHYLDTTARVSCPSITCEQAAEIAAMLRAQNRELMDVHDALHRECDGNADLPAEIRALRKEREELADERDKILGHFIELTESHTKLGLDCWTSQQEACGFAWDCGREIALKDDVIAELAHRCKHEKESNGILLECVADLERDNERRERIDAGLSVEANTTTWEEATGDLDPGVYEGTGKGFKK